MQKAVIKRSSENKVPVGDAVTVCIRQQIYLLNGWWNWELHCAAVFASDVMDFPDDFLGTKGIIHPDDLARVGKTVMGLSHESGTALSFRLITTYGEIKILQGQHLSLGIVEQVPQSGGENVAWTESLEKHALHRQAILLQQRSAMADVAETLYQLGSFTMNKRTGACWFSNGVYRLHGLPPQSLNAHANTFNPFLHPDDRRAFLQAFDAAYAAEVPLHIDYRILLASGEPRTLRLVSYWAPNHLGQATFTGILHDLSGDKIKEEQTQAVQEKLRLHQQVLKTSERAWNTGYWFLNLITRKLTFSDNYCRLYGLKPQAVFGLQTFLSQVHSDDRQQVQKLYEEVYQQQELPETVFRIIRLDGRLRYLKQTGKLLATGHHPVIAGYVQDITVQRGLERKQAELNEKLTGQQAVETISEELNGTGHIMWGATGQITCSEGFFRLLGNKPPAGELPHRYLYRHIHPDDLRAFKEAEKSVKSGQESKELHFRLLHRTGERHLFILFHRVGSGSQMVVVGFVKDVTNKTTLQQNWAEAQRFAESLMHASNDLVLLTDAENRVLAWNFAAEEKTGRKASGVLNRNLFDVFPLLTDETYREHLQAACSGSVVREQWRYNLYLRKAHHYTLTPLKNEEGIVTRVLHVVKDVSRELDLQQQLSDRLRFIESLVESSVDCIVVLDRNMNYLYWNKKAEEFYGVSKSRVIGHNILEVFPRLFNEPGYAEFRKVLRGETVYLAPSLSDKNAGYMEMYLIPVKDERNEVTAVLWIMHDLHRELQLQQERHNALQLLAVKHHHLKEAQAIGQVGSFEWDSATGSIYWSDELFRIHGMQPGEVLTYEKVVSLIHPDDRAALIDNIAPCKTKAAKVHLTHRILNPNGEVRTVSRHLESFADETGNVTHLSGTVQDITEQVQAAQELQAAKEILQATLDSFPYMIQAFKAVRDKSGKIVDFTWLMLNKKAFVQYGDTVGKSLLQRYPSLLQTGLFNTFVQVTETGIAAECEVSPIHGLHHRLQYLRLVKMDDGFVMNTEDVPGWQNYDEQHKQLAASQE